MPSALRFLSLCCIVLIALAAASTTSPANVSRHDHVRAFVTLRSGRRLRLSDLSVHSGLSSVDAAHRALYEVRGTKLSGHDVDVDLHEITTASNEKMGRIPILVDGVDMTDNTEHGFIRKGPQYSFAHMGDGTIVSIWGPGLTLVPMHMIDHPGVFINSADSTHEDVAHVNRISEFARNVHDESGSSEPPAVVLGDVFDPVATGTPLVMDADSALTTATLRESIRNGSSIGGKCRLGRIAKRVDIAGVGDSLLCSRFGGHAGKMATAIRAAVDLANAPYLRQTCIKLSVKSLDLKCDKAQDPYRKYRSFSNSTKVLLDFQQMWNWRHWNVNRSVTFFFPGWSSKDNTLGIAFIKSMCNKTEAYGWAQGLDPMAIAHELGHILGCSHAGSGIMSSRRVSSTSMYFDITSLGQIFDFVDKTPQSKCLVPQPLVSRSCSLGFSRNKAYTCSTKNVGYIYSPRDTSVRVTVKMIQRYRHVKLSFEGTYGVEISKLSVLLSYKALVYESELPKRRDVSGDKSLVLYRVGLSSIRMPYNHDTCCGELAQLFVHSSIRFCRGEACVDGAIGMRTFMYCSSCESGKRFMISTKSRECMSCS